MSTHPDALPPGYQLDEYVIDRVLGRGGFGITYLAHSMSIGVPFAIKEYFPQSYATRTARVTLRPSSEGAAKVFFSARDRFHREMQAQARFRHPNIVRVSRVFQANETYYAVLDYEDGPSFKAWLASLGRRPTQGELDSLLGPLLAALEAVHDQGMIHRDIAPDNILLRRDGSPVLIDFGAAKDLQQGTQNSTQAIVKHGFSPIEQYSGNARDQGPWTDIYALGATLYTALMGSPPAEASARQVRDERQSLNALLGDGYRPGFLHGIDWALSLHHSQRPPNVAIWRQELFEGAQSGPLTGPVTQTAPQPATRPAPREQMFTQPPMGEPPRSMPQPYSAQPSNSHGTAPAAGGNWPGFTPTGPAIAPATTPAPQATPADGMAVTHYGHGAPQSGQGVGGIGGGGAGRPAAAVSGPALVTTLVGAVSVLLFAGGLALVASEDLRFWTAARLPASVGCALDPRVCPGAAPPASPAKAVVPPTPVIEPAIAPAPPRQPEYVTPPTAPPIPTPPRDVPTNDVRLRPPPEIPAPPAAPQPKVLPTSPTSAATAAALSTSLTAALAQLDTCLAATPCNQAGCRRAFDGVTETSARDQVADRLARVAASAQDVCRAQREDGALAELQSCTDAEPCEFDTVCVSDFRAAVPGALSQRASGAIDTARRKAAGLCRR